MMVRRIKLNLPFTLPAGPAGIAASRFSPLLDRAARLGHRHVDAGRAQGWLVLQLTDSALYWDRRRMRGGSDAARHTAGGVLADRVASATFSSSPRASLWWQAFVLAALVLTHSVQICT